MARSPKFTRPKRKRFIRELSKTDNISSSAMIAGISPTTVYNYIENDPEFNEQVKMAKKVAGDSLEAKGLARATKGHIQQVWYKGKRVGFKREPSDALLMFMMRGSKPEKYRESVQALLPPDKPTTINVLVLARQVSLASRLLDNDTLQGLTAPLAGLDQLEGETVTVITAGKEKGPEGP